MKWLILLSLLSVNGYASGYNDVKKLDKFTCFLVNDPLKPKHTWETQSKELPWAFAEKDNTAMRIFQPAPFCTENRISLKDCKYYWDRTMEFSNNDSDWGRNIFRSVTFIKCPKEFNKNNYHNKVR